MAALDSHESLCGHEEKVRRQRHHRFCLLCKRHGRRFHQRRNRCDVCTSEGAWREHHFVFYDAFSGSEACAVVEKHQFTIAFHNHDQVDDPNQFSTGESILKGLAMSPWYRSNLDVGHYVESNLDPIEFIRQNHEKITHLHVADGQKNHGVEVPFGTGDTPLKAVVNLLKDNHYNIVGMVELEYRNPPGSNCAIEVRKCLDYLEQAMA